MSGGEIVVVKRGGGDGSRYPLESGAATLGRGLSCDIRVLLSTVSEEQCVVTVHKNQALIRNLSDNNLTLVNGKSVQVKALDDGDVITMGDRSLRWEYFNKDRNSKSNVAKIPTGKIKFTKKKRTSTAGSSGRRSEVAAKRIDPQVKKILDLKTRASLSDIHNSTRQIAVVKPQRRSADPPSDEAAGERPGAPGTPSRRRRERGVEASESHTQLAEIKADNRTSSECKPRLVTKPHRGKSNSPGVKATRRSLKSDKTPVVTQSDTSSAKNTPRASQRVTKNVSPPILAQVMQVTTKLKSKKSTSGAENTTHVEKKFTPRVDKETLNIAKGISPKKATPKLTNSKAIGKLLTPKVASPQLVKIATPKRAATPKLPPKKVKTPTTGKKSTPHYVNVEKINDPLTLDANKKVALLLLTGRSPVKKNLPITETKTPEKSGSKRQTPTKAGSSKKNTPKFIVKRQSPIKTPKNTGTAKEGQKNTLLKQDKPAATPKKSETPTSHGSLKSPKVSVKPEAASTPEIFATSVATTILKDIASPKTPKEKKSNLKSPKADFTTILPTKAVATPKTIKSVAKPKTPKETQTSALNPKNTADTSSKSLRDSSARRKTATPTSKTPILASKSDIIESTPNASGRKSNRDSSGGRKSATPKSKNSSLANESYIFESTPNVSARDSSARRKTATPKSKNASLANESNVFERTLHVSAKKSTRYSSGGRESATPKSKNASLANESDVFESTPNVSARESIRDSSARRKTATPKSKNASSANESHVFERTPNVSAKKSTRDSSGGRESTTTKSKNARLANESDVFESTPNVSTRESIRGSSARPKTATPKSKNPSSADESDVFERTPNVSAKKSTRDSSGGRESTTTKSKNAKLANESDVFESTPNVSARESIRDSSARRKTATPKSKNASSANESHVFERTPNVSAKKSTRDSSGGRESTTTKSKNARLANESDVFESTPNVSTRESIRGSSARPKTATPKSKNPSSADESDVFERTPNVSAKKSTRDSSGGRESTTTKSKNAKLANESDVFESTPNVSARESIRDSSARRKTATPKSKNASSANESHVFERTPNVSAKKSTRDSSGGRESTTTKSKNARLANESDVFESTPNVSTRESIRGSSARPKTATPKSKNASLADESDVFERTPNVSAKKSTRDSSGGRESATPKSNSASLAADNLLQNTPITSPGKSARDSSRKTISPMFKNKSLETTPIISISSAKKSKTSISPQTQILDKKSLSSGRKSALKSPNYSVRKNESIKFDLSNLEKGDENNSPPRGRKRKSNNMTADSDIDLKLRFSDITEPSPKGSSAEHSTNQSRSSNILHKTMSDSQISLPVRISDAARRSNNSTLNASTINRSPHSALLLHDTSNFNTSARSTRISRLSAKHITETIVDSDLDDTVESNQSQSVTRDKSKNRSRTRNSTIFLDSTGGSSENDTSKNNVTRRTSKKSGFEFTSDGYSIVDLVSDQSSNIETIEKTTPGIKTPKSTLKTRKTLPFNANTSVNLKTRQSLINNKFFQSVTSTPLKKIDLPNIDNVTPVSSPIAIGKGPRLLVRSGKKTLSPKKTSAVSGKTSLLLSKSLTISDTKSQKVHGRSASTGSPVNKSRKSSNKGTPSMDSRKSNRASVNISAFLYEDISEASNSRRSKSSGTPPNVSVDKVVKNMRKSPSTPENKIPHEEATTPVLSVTDLLNASKASFKRTSIRNTIDHFECMSTPKTPVATQKVTRKTLGAIGDRINLRKSELESLADERKTRTDPRKVTRSIIKKNTKNTNLNVSAIKKISARVNKKNDQSPSEQESIASDTTDVNAQKPENDIVITPKSTIKLVPEILKEKHSTAKKPFSRKSIIDHLNESQEMVKELFRSPVKRKLSQSMVQYSAMQDSDDEFNESVNEVNNSSIRDKPKNKRLSALSKQTPNQTPNVTFDFDSVKTPHVPTDVFVSPLDDSDKRRSARNSLSNFVGVKKLFSRNTPKNDLTDVRGLKSLMRTPGVRKSPKNDLTQVPIIKTLFATNKKKAKSPKNDLTNVTGVKRMLKTPIPQKSPHNDLTKISNVRNLFSSPGRGRKSPQNDLSNVSGVTKLFRNPRSPRNALEELSGVEDLFNSSSSTLKEVETSSSLFDNLIGKTPPKHTYQKSKSFVKEKEEPITSRSNKSMCPLEIIENHVEDWLDKELERRTRRDSDISKNDEEVNTSQSQKNTPLKLNKTSKKTNLVIEASKLGSSRKSKVDRELSKLVIDAVGGDVEITPNRRARRLATQEKSNYSLEVSKATPSKTTKSTQKILLPLKKRSISNDKFRISGVKVTTQNRSRSQSTLNISQSPNTRPNSRLSALSAAHSEAEMSLPLKKRTILKNDGALGHSTPVKKRLTPKKVQDSSIVDLGPVSPISKSSRDTPQQTESKVEEQIETPNETECAEDSTATTKRVVQRRAPTKNISSTKVEKSTRTHRNNTANLSKPNSPKSVSPRLVLEKKGTPKFSPKYKSQHPISDEFINTEKSSEKSDRFKIITPKLNVAKKTLTKSKRGQKNVTEEIIDESNSVSTQEKVTTPKRTKRTGKQDKVESSPRTEEIVGEVTAPKNESDNTPVTPEVKAGRSRAVKKVASIDSSKPKSTRGRGKNSVSVQNETVNTSVEVVVEVKKPASGRGKGKKNTTKETNNASEISLPESIKVSSSKGQLHSVEKNNSVQDSPKQTLKKVQKANSKVVEEITHKDNVSIQDGPKPVAKRGRKAAAEVVLEIQGDVSIQDSLKPATRGRRAIKEDISVQDNPEPVPKRGRKAAVPKVVEGSQEEYTSKDEISVSKSPKSASKRARKPVSKALEDSSKQTGRRKRVVEEKESVTEEVKPSSPKKGRGRRKIVENNTEANVSNVENGKPTSGRRKKGEPVSTTKKVTFSESASDESSSITKPTPKGRASRRKAADEAEVESEKTSAKDPKVPPKRARRGAQPTTDSSAEVKEAPKSTRGKKTTKVASPTKSSPVAARSTRATRQKK